MDEVSRRAHLQEVADLLWQDPLSCHIETGRRFSSNGAVEEYLVIPNAREPRMLVPSTARAAAAAVRGHAAGTSLKRRLGAAALDAGLRVGLGPWVFPDRLRVYQAHPSASDDSITTHLEKVLGEPVQVAMPVTRPRPNRKPVLRVLDAQAKACAFVKVGMTDLAKDLVLNESRALVRLSQARLSETTVPEVLACHAWRELELLVLAPLPLNRRSGVAMAPSILASAREIGSVNGLEKLTLVESPYWQTLRRRLDACNDQRAAELARAMGNLAVTIPLMQVTFGAWHGDWAPWNMASHEGRLLVWDLERFETGVPLGMDSLHYDLQTRILPTGSDPVHEILARLSHADEILAPMEVDPRSSKIVYVAYLLEIAARWLTDRPGAAGQGNRVLDGMIDATMKSIEQVTADWVTTGRSEDGLP